VTTTALPPCGLYRTSRPIGDVAANRLVYFHNHGNPGPGLYFPERWNSNRAQFAPNGTTVPQDFDPSALTPLLAEGFYRVTKAFHCCSKQCTRFEPDAFLQLGYNGSGQALLFVPELVGGSIGVPERGTLIDDAAFASLAVLQVNERREPEGGISLPRGIVIH